MKLTLAQSAGMLGLPPPAGEAGERLATGYSLDSRTIQAGELFFAVRGPRHDGHDFLDAAFSQGAAAAVVARRWRDEHSSEAAGLGPLLVVDDPAAALRALAAAARRRWGRPVVAVTGSNGKTTTKDLAAALLATRYRVSKSSGNLNNDFGVPVSILRIEDEAEIAVLELGMNHPGEIRRLARMANPDAGVVTNVSAAHIGNFRSLGEVAAAKRELIEELPAGGTAVLNADDERVRGFDAGHPGPAVTFGFSESADWRGVGVETLGVRGSRFRLQRKSKPAVISFETRLTGRHNVSNLLAALAVCGLFEIEPYDLQEAVAKAVPVTMRGVVREIEGVIVIDDSYNANPQAMAAMLEVLRQTPARRRIAVLGAMLELGESSSRFHREIGAAAAQAELDLLIVVGEPAQPMGDAARREGMPASGVMLCEDAEASAGALLETLCAGDVVLFKGSRAVGLDRAIAIVDRRLTGGAGREGESG